MLSRQSNPPKYKPITIKQYTSADDVNITNYLEEAIVLFDDSDDINTLWTKFKAHCHFCIQYFIPDKVKKVGRTNPWINREIIHMKRKLKRLRKRSNAAQADIFHLQATLKSKLAASRDHYFNVTLNRFVSESPSKFWQFLSNKGGTRLDQIAKGDRVLTDPREVAEVFNEYFQSVFSTSDPLNGAVCENGDCGVIQISLEGVTELLLRLDPKKSTGPDDIPSAFLRRYATLLARFLVVILQKSVSSGAIPDDWRIARVTPVYKKGNRLNFCNYRPISLTCHCCKLLEHIIAKYLNNFLQSQNILTEHQHGFRRGLSTTTQLLTTINEFAKALDAGSQVDVIFFDLSKAFDKVPHKKLINKLKSIGVPSDITNWVTSYLLNRKQYVEIEGSRSRFLDVFSGVPQGSVLGPVLFNIYINDLVQAIDTSVSVKLFADDCILFKVINSTADQQVLNRNIGNLETWCSEWNMVINLEKTAHLCITNKINKFHFKYDIKRSQITQVEEYKYLGVTITSSLNWTTHIVNTCSSARKKLGFLKHRLANAPSSLKLKAYKTMVRPSLEYASVVWDPHTKSNIQKIEKIQRLAARFIYSRYRRRDSPSAMLQLANLEPLEDRRRAARLNLLRLIYFSKLEIKPENYMVKDSSRPSRHKHSCSIKPIFARTNLYKHSFFPKSISEWNLLPRNSTLLSFSP